MHHVVLAHEADWEGWRSATRALALADVPAEDITWSVADGARPTPLPDATGTFTVARACVALAETAIQACDPGRFGLLYGIVRRARNGMRAEDDPDLPQARRLALAVRREAHRMQSLVRFRPVADHVADHVADGGVCHVGWFEPAQFVLDAVSRAYARAYAHLPFSILTPARSAHWTGTALSFGPGVEPDAIADDDGLEAAWRARFADLFEHAAPPPTSNTPPPVDLRAPDRPALGPVRLPPTPMAAVLTRAAQEAEGCRRCPLWQPATQTVFGEGPPDAPIMFIGEQPGDQEDIIGRPFVGPAGQLLDQALEEAGIDRRQTYVANVVKHFKFLPRGPRRLHQTPETPEIEACRFWLELERAEVRPSLVVLLGGTAARTVLGRPVTIGRERGALLDLPDGTPAFITVHPSFLLRQPDEESKARQYQVFVNELRQAAALAGAGGRTASCQT